MQKCPKEGLAWQPPRYRLQPGRGGGTSGRNTRGLDWLLVFGGRGAAPRRWEEMVPLLPIPRLPTFSSKFKSLT
ncbi:hypothetical protein E2C01_078340 [Portunus trituberculatus]|uniref:Uncharacterized protein n=1 Tax=Portunus trituberculatus TaxID=210409 RepID=A0A5B7IPV9_PORTR|nr:hypothetical protein [Portunus trituberculatus]